MLVWSLVANPKLWIKDGNKSRTWFQGKKPCIFCAGEVTKPCGCWCKPFICPRKRVIIFSWSWWGTEQRLSSTSRQIFAWETWRWDFDVFATSEFPLCFWLYCPLGVPGTPFLWLSWNPGREFHAPLLHITFSFWDNFSSPLFSWSLEKYVNDSKAEATSLALGRPGDAGKEREIADPWQCLLEGTSAGQPWTRNPWLCPAEISWGVLWVPPPVLCSAGLAY